MEPITIGVVALLLYIIYGKKDNSKIKYNLNKYGQMSVNDVTKICAKYWEGKDLEKALFIINRESARNPNARLFTRIGDKLTIGKKTIIVKTPEDSRGLMQINIFGNPWANKYDLYNPEINIAVGYELWKVSGWKPWTTYAEYKNT